MTNAPETNALATNIANAPKTGTHEPQDCPHCIAHGLTRDHWANAYKNS